MTSWKSSTTPVFAALTLLLMGCGGGGDTAADGSAGSAATAPLVIENAATLSGRVAFTGTAPAPRPIDMRDEPDCAARHPNGAADESIVATDGGLANVFIWISEGITDRHPTPATPVVIDQVGCVYAPRVVGAQTGQTIILRNSDGLAHNIKATPRANRPFNISQPNNMDTSRSFTTPEIMIPLECNVHGWMRAYVGVVDHPYFAVSDASGGFSIANLPAGAYTVEAWHERLGRQTRQITVGPNETAAIDFSFDGSAASDAGPAAAALALHETHSAPRQ